MPVRVDIPDQDIRHCNSQAQDELKRCVKKYADDVLAEAGRLEVETKTTGGNPEIISSMIKDADILLRKGYRRPRKPKWLVVIQVFVTVASLGTGVLTNWLGTAWVLALFIALLIIVAILTTVLTVQER